MDKIHANLQNKLKKIMINLKIGFVLVLSFMKIIKINSQKEKNSKMLEILLQLNTLMITFEKKFMIIAVKSMI